MTRREELQHEHSVERELLARYRARRDEALRDLADAQARAERYEKAVVGLEAVVPDEDGPEHSGASESPASDRPLTSAVPVGSTNGASPKGSGPRGEAAVATVLREAGPTGLTPLALTAALAHRGWAPNSEHPENAVRAAANRLRKKDSSIGFVDGKYFHRFVSASVGQPSVEEHHEET
jgi:hypothetical protein